MNKRQELQMDFDRLLGNLHHLGARGVEVPRLDGNASESLNLVANRLEAKNMGSAVGFSRSS